MEVNCFQILLIDVTFYFEHVLKVVHNVLIKNKKRIYTVPAVKGFIGRGQPCLFTVGNDLVNDTLPSP